MREELYPSVWRARHRLALYIACGIGAAVGLVPGIRKAWRADDYGTCGGLLGDTFESTKVAIQGWFWGGDCSPGEDLGWRWAAFIGWPLFGALLAGAAIIVWRLMTVPPLGYPGNPVMGEAAPPGHEWKIVDTWPPSGRRDTPPETDQEASQFPAPSAPQSPPTGERA